MPDTDDTHISACRNLDAAVNKPVSMRLKAAINFVGEIAEFIDGTPIVSWSEKDGLSICIPVEVSQKRQEDAFSIDSQPP